MACIRCSQLDEQLKNETVPFLEHEQIVTVCLFQKKIIDELVESIKKRDEFLDRLINIIEHGRIKQ